MLYLTHALNGLLMIGLPLALGVFLARRLGVGWRLFWIGAVTFAASQVVHLPLNIGLTRLAANGTLPRPPDEWKLVINAAILGLTAGLCEETARYLIYRGWLKSARTWREGLMFGAGHGGIEAMIFGTLALYAFIQLAALRSTDLSTLNLSAEQLAAVQSQMTEYWSAPWYATLVGALERVFALCFHLSAAVMVLQAFTRKNSLWLILAILWHAAIDGLAVYAVGTWDVYAAEGVAGVAAVISLGIIFALRSRAPMVARPGAAAFPAPALPAPAPVTPVPVEVSKEKLDQTRYQ